MDTKSASDPAAHGTATNREIELKLRAHPDSFEALRNAPSLARAAAGTGGNQSLAAVYYDTEDLRLRRRGISFRVRKEGDRFIQTIKLAGSAAGALSRREWNTQVPTLAPYPGWITEAEARARIGFLVEDELKELFRTVVERETVVIGYDGDAGHGAVVEVAFDRGSIECGERMVPIAEVELELLKGAPSALYALGLELLESAPVHVETRSKPDRAYELVTRERPAWVKGRKPAFEPDVIVDTALTTVFHECFAHWMANEPAALDGSHPEGVHQMRVALRRLKSALTIFADVLPPGQLHWLRTETRWVANALGPARNWDVFLDELLEPLLSARPDDRALAALRHSCERMRRRGYQTARSAINSARYTRFVLRLGAWLERSGWRDGDEQERLEHLREPLKMRADRIMSRRHRKVVRLGKHLEAASVIQRHELRLAMKKLRYASEFFASLYAPKRTKAYGNAVSTLQDTLGALNDVAETEARLDSIMIDGLPEQHRDELLKAIGMVIGWSAENASHVEPRLLEQWARFRKTKVFWNPVRKRDPERTADADATKDAPEADKDATPATEAPRDAPAEAPAMTAETPKDGDAAPFSRNGANHLLFAKKQGVARIVSVPEELTAG